ncbi:MAG: radical SAM protein [Candidatus Altiarchaeales archaeon]|nr:radical SAM protein [Candidatus Altiarchaeales archaeon]MBD3415635.1 radical SAM protein [Candidatus Altiarchaeales archaeon]
MKVALANPPWFETGHAVRAGSRWPHAEFDEEEDRTGYSPFPFFLAYAAAVCEADGHKVKVMDALTLGETKEKFLSDLKSFSPDLVVMESSTPSINTDLKTAEMLKAETDCKIALCGPHVTTFPGDILSNKQVDYVFMGEYEHTCRDTVRAMEGKMKKYDVLGLAYREGKKAKVNDRRPLIDLNELPYPARHLMEMEHYCEPFMQTPNVQMIQSRGCTFGCVYCLWPPVMYGGMNFRFRKPESVVEECHHVVKEHKARELYFDDDTFNLNPQKVFDFCKEYKDNGPNKIWGAMCSPVPVTKELLEAMHDSGCEALKFGVESGSRRILDLANRKNQDLKHVEDVFRWCKEIGIRSHATFMIGLPGETRKTMDETFNYLLKIKPDSFQVSVCTPLPGTQYYDKAKSEGHLHAKCWDDYSNIHFIHDKPVVSTDELTQEDLKKASNYANNYLIYQLYLKKAVSEPRWTSFKITDTFRRHGLNTFNLLFRAGSRVLKSRVSRQW